MFRSNISVSNDIALGAGGSGGRKRGWLQLLYVHILDAVRRRHPGYSQNAGHADAIVYLEINNFIKVNF